MFRKLSSSGWINYLPNFKDPHGDKKQNIFFIFTWSTAWRQWKFWDWECPDGTLKPIVAGVTDHLWRAQCHSCTLWSPGPRKHIESQTYQGMWLKPTLNNYNVGHGKLAWIRKYHRAVVPSGHCNLTSWSCKWRIYFIS